MAEIRRKVLVTGGAGYIGSHTVVELWEAGFEPIIIDNFSNSNEEVLERIDRITGRQTKCYKVDCVNLDLMREVFEREEGIYGAIHFAAFKAVGESVRSPLKYYRNNLESLTTLVDLMQQFGVENLVFSSSCTVYGIPDDLPVTEQSQVKPAESPYGFTKQVCESICKDAARAFDKFKVTLLRYFNPIGAHSSGIIGELPLGPPENLVPYITQTAAGIREKLTVFGDDYDTADGTCIRDYIHVVDLAQAHIAALEWLGKQTRSLAIPFNIGTGRGASVMELIQSFEKVNDLELNYVIGQRRPGDVPAIFADPTFANEELGWKAKLSMEQALKDSWNWQRSLDSFSVNFD